MGKKRQVKVKMEMRVIDTGTPVIYTREQAEGAIPNGSLVEKCNSVPGDSHQDGAPAHVMGSIGPVDGVYGYFVEWLDKPNTPCAVTSTRVRLVV